MTAALSQDTRRINDCGYTLVCKNPLVKHKLNNQHGSNKKHGMANVASECLKL
ncbi:hypothetical protein HAL013_08130 [Helicobacter ailurogastricus]|uniref:Uncharacterized protein n=1 Tax=Helicobacter ailurogastricus TaxID=1578720 RepID=A0A0K2X6D8_9HELI|nr:hypothetical protein HAL011_14340 [Helicobacter ailurogastricus]CRF42618.1 hypothetical protein HAL013_08130 [Helicobacter ailurogastricus]CRF44146.1 hypothetical protein HAL09_07160 [Helicobacter ailurogastricus]